MSKMYRNFFNRTEQVTGRWHTLRLRMGGFKSSSGLHSAFWVCANRALWFKWNKDRPTVFKFTYRACDSNQMRGGY